jgi:hypothetical protein
MSMKKLIYPIAAVILIFVLLFNVFTRNTGGDNNVAPVNPTATSVPTETHINEVAPTDNGEVPPPYVRSNFGKDWKYMGNSCDMRQVVLAEKMQNVTFKPGSNCKVASGEFTDVYTGLDITFNSSSPNAVPIDHVFSLSEAWNAGAWKWTFEDRVAFANDIENLTPSTQYINSWKSDHSLGEIYNCVNDVTLNCAPTKQAFIGMEAFTAAYVHIAQKYNLALDADSATVAALYGY